MLKILTALDIIIKDNRFLQAGLADRLFNLSQLARYLQPVVEARLKKDVKASAITMNLSRMQQEMEKTSSFRSSFRIEKLTVQAHLFAVTFPNIGPVRQAVQKFQRHVYKEGGFISVTQSSREITMITGQSFLEEMSSYISNKPISLETNITGIGVQFAPDYSQQPGFLHAVLQRVALQNINVVEVFSTYSEFSLFFAHEDSKLALDTLFSSFQVMED